MMVYKSMYHQLQNLEDFPEILPAAKDLLLSLLDSGLSIAHYRDEELCILKIDKFSPEHLRTLLKAQRQVILDEFESYSDRRLAGGGPELFCSRDEALDWLKRRAPLNLVDGAWLSRVHRITTPFFLRHITRDLWQTLSEELGDGDVEKNHVHVFRELLRENDIRLPDADSADFTHARHDMEYEQSWRSATGQLLISLWSNEFLPELLGFNLHFESLSASDLKATRELPEFGISAYYYLLHISIDNADSGHSAMALETIIHFMRTIEETAILDYQTTWKRIQAGYLLSQSLADDLTVSDYEDQVVEMLRRKSLLAKMMHCNSKALIGKRKIKDWFSLAAEAGCVDNAWRDSFITALAGSKPWVYRGNSEKSQLVRELAWKGKMFGAFTDSETRLLCAWIDNLPAAVDDTAVYWKRVGGNESTAKALSPPRQDIAFMHPFFAPMPPRLFGNCPIFTAYPPLRFGDTFSVHALTQLWFAHPCLLENTVASPYQTITRLNSLSLQLLRADMGYKRKCSGVAGVDEQRCADHHQDVISIGLSMVRKCGTPIPTCLGELFDATPDETNLDQDQCYGTRSHPGADSTSFVYSLLSWSAHPKKNQTFLLGLARAFVDLEALVSDSPQLLPGMERRVLLHIVKDKLQLLQCCLGEIGCDERKMCDFVDGYRHGRTGIEAHVGLLSR